MSSRARFLSSPRTLTAQSALLLVISIVPVLLVLSGLNYRYDSAILQDQTRRNLREGVIRLDQTLSGVLLRELERLHTEATNATLGVATKARAAGPDRGALQQAYEQVAINDYRRIAYVNNDAARVLKSFRERFPNRAVVLLANRTGELLSTTTPLWPFWDVSSQPWWPDLARNGADAVTITAPVTVPGFESLLFLALPVTDAQNQVSGVVAVGLRFQDVVAPIMNQSDHAGSLIQLTTATGAVLYATSPGAVTQLPASWKPLFTSLDADTTEQGPDIVAYAPLQVAEGYPLDDARSIRAVNHLGWTILQITPQTVAFAALQGQGNLLGVSSVIAGIVLVLLTLGALQLSIRRLVTRPLQALEGSIHTIRQQGLTPPTLAAARQRLPQSINEVGRLGQLFGQMLEELMTLTQEQAQSYHQQQAAVRQLRAASTRLSAAAAQQEQITRQTNAILARTLAAFQAFDAAAVAIADGAWQVATQAAVLKAQHEAGQQAVVATQQVLDQLQQTAESLEQGAQSLVSDARAASTLSGEAQDIADTTHLLSLNALIEAAGAGAAGARFTVVASEVRDLANVAQRAAESIEQALERMSGQSHTTALAVQGARRAVYDGAAQMAVLVDFMQTLVQSADTLVLQAEQIRQHNTDQRDRSNAVHQSSSQLVQEMQDLTAASEQILAQAQDLLQLAGSLDHPRLDLIVT
jgi:methyl-accepting chemotaxis protein